MWHRSFQVLPSSVARGEYPVRPTFPAARLVNVLRPRSQGSLLACVFKRHDAYKLEGHAHASTDPLIFFRLLGSAAFSERTRCRERFACRCWATQARTLRALPSSTAALHLTMSCSRDSRIKRQRAVLRQTLWVSKSVSAAASTLAALRADQLAFDGRASRRARV